jgi:hypothetical protein
LFLALNGHVRVPRLLAEQPLSLAVESKVGCSWST